jgi:hypothetical protein
VYVGIGSVELLLGLDRRNQRPAVTGSYGIDEHQVGEIQPRARIVGQLRRIRRAVSLHAELDALRADGAQIQKDGGRARTAVQREGDRPVLTLHGVRGEDHLARLLAAFIDRQRAHGNRVMERFAVELNALRNMRIRGQRSLLVAGLLLILRVGGRRRSCRLCFGRSRSRRRRRLRFLRPGDGRAKSQHEHGEHARAGNVTN